MTQTFFLSAGEVNAEAEMSLPLLTAKLIDIATADSNSLGIGNPAMAHLDCGWVLSRLTIEMSRYPTVNEQYALTTWIEDINRHFSIRCFRVDDGEGNPIGYARSIWMVMNWRTHENAGLSHLDIRPDMMSRELLCPIPRQGRHTHIDVSFLQRTYTFRFCDLDFYRHVNTVRYIDLLLNSFSLAEMDAMQIRRLEISFLHEGRYGKMVEIRRRQADIPEGNRAEFLIYEPEKEREILYARIDLRDRNHPATPSSASQPNTIQSGG